ncbi:hypothetical protein [Nocardia grenadensis]|uniref:hypothetical protein n=1 Tax=Nocardia grenadensis TaxID=931537 RepID=UPI003D8BA51B
MIYSGAADVVTWCMTEAAAAGTGRIRDHAENPGYRHGRSASAPRPRPDASTGKPSALLTETLERRLASLSPGLESFRERTVEGNKTAEVLQTKDAQLSDKSPRSTMSKKQGKSIKEKRAEKKAKSAATESGVEALESKSKKRK